MEHIGKLLGSLDRGKAIPSRRIIEPEFELTLADKREELRKSMGVSSMDNTFEALKPWPGTEEALAAFKALASGETNWKMLLVYGGVGNGKTHFCEATAIALYKRGLFCRVMTMDRMMRMLKESIGSDRQISFDELVGNYSSGSLILDDVAGTEWEFEQLEKIIRVRYRENLFTILTTNLDLKELPERIVSRFRDPEKGRVILNQGEDYRPEKGRGVSKDATPSKDS